MEYSEHLCVRRAVGFRGGRKAAYAVWVALPAAWDGFRGFVHPDRDVARDGIMLTLQIGKVRERTEYGARNLSLFYGWESMVRDSEASVQRCRGTAAAGTHSETPPYD